jgi:Tetracyclin repressor-like, C-terminal domain
MEATLAGFRNRMAHEVSELLGERLGAFGLGETTTEPSAFAVVGMATAVGEWWMDKRSMSRQGLVRELTAALWGGFRAVIEQTELGIRHTAPAARTARTKETKR